MRKLIVALACAVMTASMAFAQDAKKKKETVTFYIEAMHCNKCVNKIEKNIAFEKGVTDLKCDLDTHTAEVTFKSAKTNQGNLEKAFDKIGMHAVAVDPATVKKDQSKKKK